MADATSPRVPGGRPSSALTWTSVLAALSLLIATAIGQLLELFLKSTNPDGVDVTNGLAYLQPILITTLVLVAVALVGTVLAIVRLSRTEGTASARLPWTLLFVQVVVWFATVAARAALGPIIDGS